MTENIPVICLTDRTWDIASQTYTGQQKNGVLIGIGHETAETGTEPVGIVCFDDGSFESVPFRFITKNNN